MKTRHFLEFADVGAPLLLNDSAALIDPIRDVLGGWPFTLSHDAPGDLPFFAIDAGDAKGQFRCQDLTVEAAKPRTLDAVNAVCDLIAAMSRALPASQPTLICLHAAAIEVAGRLVVIPNARRAGKSTLAACLARLGCLVFTDDFLAVSFDQQGSLVGRANGVCPRLRLPLPGALPDAFKTWARENSGPANTQYQYLSLDVLPASGTTLPLGAILLIDREDDVRATLEDVSPDDAMEVLLRQNFTRDVHSAAVLTVMERLMSTLTVNRLRYNNAPDAAACIMETFATWPTPIATSAAHAGQVFNRAATSNPMQGAIQPDNAYFQMPGAAAATIGDAIYLTDPHGAGIHRLNVISRAIWLLLGAPITPDHIVKILELTFPEVPGSDIRRDTENLLDRLARAGLICGHAG